MTNQKENRKCIICGATLSRFNKSPQCWCHDEPADLGNDPSCAIGSLPGSRRAERVRAVYRGTD